MIVAIVLLLLFVALAAVLMLGILGGHRPGEHATSSRPSGPARGLLLGVALLLGVVGDQWFRSPWAGLGIPLYVLLVLVALVGLGAWERRAPAWRNAWCVPPLL